MKKILAKILSYKWDRRLLLIIEVPLVLFLLVEVYRETGAATASAIGVLFLMFKFLSWAVSKVTKVLLRLVNNLNSGQRQELSLMQHSLRQAHDISTLVEALVPNEKRIKH